MMILKKHIDLDYHLIPHDRCNECLTLGCVDYKPSPEPEMWICPTEYIGATHNKPHAKREDCDLYPKCIPYVAEAAVKLPEDTDREKIYEIMKQYIQCKYERDMCVSELIRYLKAKGV